MVVINLSQKNFYRICRICYEQNDLKNIFQSKYRNVTFANIFENYIHLKISERDALSPYICLKCIKSLLILNAFLEQYKIANEALKLVYNYLYKNDNRPRKKCTEINLADTLDQDRLLKDCNFVDFNRENCDNSSLINSFINAPVKEEHIETLIVKNELENIDFDKRKTRKKRTSTDLQLQCFECNGFFKTLAGLTSHQKADHPAPIQNVTCAVCNRTYAMKYKLRRHLTVSHKNCTCATCGLKLKRSSLAKHVKMHAPDYVPYKPPRNRRLCTVCGASVRYNFNAHMRSHRDHAQGAAKQHAKGMFQCEVCAFETPHWTSLYRHKRRHKEKPFLCNTCGKDFSGKDFFDKHMKLHEPFDKPTPCYVCADIFNNEYDYSKHLSTHTYYVRKITNFDEYLKRKQKYKKRTPKTVEDNSIQKAPKKAPNPNLRKVKTTYKCEPCNKLFKDNAHLQIHVTAIHENRREHKCPYCGRGFNLPNSLQEHVRTHTGETLRCDYCERTFKQNSTRYKHLREAHNVHLGQIRKEKSMERRDRDEMRKAYKKLKMKMVDDAGEMI